MSGHEVNATVYYVTPLHSSVCHNTYKPQEQVTTPPVITPHTIPHVTIRKGTRFGMDRYQTRCV